MPYINVKTNLPVSDLAQEQIKKQLGQAIPILHGKTEDWLMVCLEPECALWFAGSDEPAVMVEVAVYGGANAEDFDQLTARITDVLQAYLEVDPRRVYVKYQECEYWGWNGSNF